MNLAAVLVFFLSVGVWSRASGSCLQVAAQNQSGSSANQTQPPANDGANPSPSSAPSQSESSSAAGKPTQPSSQAGATGKPAPKKHRAQKKSATPACTGTNCPPPKVVVKNGGSNETAVELTGAPTTQQASDQRYTEQLTAATEEKLKKIAERQLSASEQEMLNQVKQFIQQSKEAVAAGDLERGRSLATKANLLSDELVKP